MTFLCMYCKYHVKMLYKKQGMYILIKYDRFGNFKMAYYDDILTIWKALMLLTGQNTVLSGQI